MRRLSEILENRSAGAADREREIDELYEDLAEFSFPRSGPVPLSECDPPTEAGVYLFFEPGELRRNGGPRIVRVGKAGYVKLDINLRSRLLRMHLHGTHRDEQYDSQNRLLSSVFRKHVGRALIERDDVRCPTWMRSKAPSSTEERHAEAELEKCVTKVMEAMSVTWLVVQEPDRRSRIEGELIRMLSNYRRQAVDPPSEDWLGRFHDDERIRDSGLWNIEHVK